MEDGSTTILQGTGSKTVRISLPCDDYDEDENDRNSEDDTTLPLSMKDTSSEEDASSDATTLMRRAAVWAMLFCVFTDAMNVQCVAPNHPFMTLPGAHPDSFPDTEPFEFATAQYMINSAAATGAFFSDLGAGWLSDHVGRRRMVLVNLLGSVVFTIAKYLARHDYWTFVSMTFANGCFSSTPSLGVAYMAELFMDDRAKADSRMGHVMAIMVVGQSAGGLLSLVTPNDLFFPLLLATAISLFGFIVGYFFLLEPKQCHDRTLQSEQEENANNRLPTGSTEEVNKDSKEMPPVEIIDNVTLFNVIFGSLADNAGSLGLAPLALSPLMFETFHFNFVEQGLEPIMSEQDYRLLYSMVALAVIPAAFLAPWLFKKLGVAFSCVIFNLLTGCFVISLLYIALIEPATRTTFASYVSLVYVGFSLTIISQLTTGPMLDRITPLDKKGFVQGIAYAVYDGSQAVCPVLYGMIVDNYGISVMMWICVGISCFAALVNLPLVVHPRLQKEVPEEEKKVAEEEEEVIDFTSRTVSSLFLWENDDEDDDGEYSC